MDFPSATFLAHHQLNQLQYPVRLKHKTMISVCLSFALLFCYSFFSVSFLRKIADESSPRLLFNVKGNHSKHKKHITTLNLHTAAASRLRHSNEWKMNKVKMQLWRQFLLAFFSCLAKCLARINCIDTMKIENEMKKIKNEIEKIKSTPSNRCRSFVDALSSS